MCTLQLDKAKVEAANWEAQHRRKLNDLENEIAKADMKQNENITYAIQVPI